MAEDRMDRTEYDEVFSFCRLFFHRCYEERDPVGAAAMVAEQVICVGLGENEAARSREEFCRLMKAQMEDIPDTIPYRIVQYVQRPGGSHSWICFAQVELIVHTREGSRMRYNLRLTASVRRGGEGWSIDLLHVSEAARRQQEVCFPPVRLLSTDGESGPTILQQELRKLITQLYPGGVVSCRAEGDYPLLLANDQFLRQVGYDSFEEYREALDGCFINAIHPEDRGIYTNNVRFALATGKPCENEYRVRRRDGSFTWVHDIGRTAVSDTGGNLVVSAMLDISDQVEARHKLEVESEIDELTGVYNRKGARRIIEGGMAEGRPWLFCIIDLDNFKQVNDIYGHRQGDRVLCCAARGLQRQFGQQGMVCRLGGDEFIVFLAQYRDRAEIIRRMGAVSRDYAELLEGECPRARSTMSVGGVYGRGVRELQWMYGKADKNLYIIKEVKKGHMLLTSVEDQDSEG